jgi:hypothetical protein
MLCQESKPESESSDSDDDKALGTLYLRKVAESTCSSLPLSLLLTAYVTGATNGPGGSSSNGCQLQLQTADQERAAYVVPANNPKLIPLSKSNVFFWVF